MNDLKFACRQLRKNPGFTAVVTLTLGIENDMRTLKGVAWA